MIDIMYYITNLGNKKLVQETKYIIANITKLILNLEEKFKLNQTTHQYDCHLLSVLFG